jgi:hypothetical protein
VRGILASSVDPADRDRTSSPDRAERRALWNFEAVLETELPEVVAPDYGEGVDAA